MFGHSQRQLVSQGMSDGVQHSEGRHSAREDTGELSQVGRVGKRAGDTESGVRKKYGKLE